MRPLQRDLRARVDRACLIRLVRVQVGPQSIPLLRTKSPNAVGASATKEPLGVFTANAAVRQENWLAGQWEGWSIRQLGYLSQEAFAYALARSARARGEVKPAWATHLGIDIKAYFKRSARFHAQEGR